jgi:hypothetical protein
MTTTRNTRVRALCCECGNLRTVSANHSPPRDENRTADARDEPRGWRMTGTLKCRVCRTRTRHALLRDDTPDYRDSAEERDRRRSTGQGRQLQELSNEELLKVARRGVYELTDNVMKTVPLEELTMEDCYVVLKAFDQIADNHGL